jgi:hypothetical protein
MGSRDMQAAGGCSRPPQLQRLNVAKEAEGGVAAAAAGLLPTRLQRQRLDVAKELEGGAAHAARPAAAARASEVGRVCQGGKRGGWGGELSMA